VQTLIFTSLPTSYIHWIEVNKYIVV
jgi:hypothetical protein